MTGMKRLGILAALLLSSATMAGPTVEVLVTMTGTQLPRLPARMAIEIYNEGPNPVCCTPNVPSTQTTLTGYGCRPIQPNTSWPLTVPDSNSIICRAETADQVAGGGLRITELR